jgi:hypothetical protein
MQPKSQSQAKIYPGRANLLMDHLQLGIRHGPTLGNDPHFYLSLYVIPWSREMGSGHVALLRWRDPDGGKTDVTLTDNPSLGRAQQENLRSVGYSRVDLTSEPRAASFIRSPLKEQNHVRYLISTVGLEIEARWDGLGEAIFAYGPAPQRPDRQEIWSMLFEAEEAYAAVNGVEVRGETYPMENWIPWLGRTLNSAHVARGEILVDRPDTK